MPNQYRAWLRWVLYALWMLAAILVQTLHVGWRAPLCTVPVMVACTAMMEGAEKGGLFALIASVVWCLTGADAGPISIVTLTLCGVAAGAVCDRLLTRGLVPCLAVCLGALLVNEGAICLYHLFTGELTAALCRETLPLQLLRSLCAAPVGWALCRLSGKAGGL